MPLVKPDSEDNLRLSSDGKAVLWPEFEIHSSVSPQYYITGGLTYRYVIKPIALVTSVSATIPLHNVTDEFGWKLRVLRAAPAVLFEL